MSMSNCIIGPLFYWELWSKTRHSCWRGASKIVQAIISIILWWFYLMYNKCLEFFTSPDEVDNISWSRSLLLLETSRIKLGSIRSLTSQATLFFNWPSKKLIKSMVLDFQKTKNWNVSNMHEHFPSMGLNTYLIQANVPLRNLVNSLNLCLYLDVDLHSRIEPNICNT